MCGVAIVMAIRFAQSGVFTLVFSRNNAAFADYRFGESGFAAAANFLESIRF